MGDWSRSREISEEAMPEVQVTVMEVKQCWGEEVVGHEQVSEVELMEVTDGLEKGRTLG